LKVSIDGKVKHLSEVDILAMATGLKTDDCKMIISLGKRLGDAERDRDYWRDLAIKNQQKYEEVQRNEPTRTTLA
jgi:hypothetical protein